MSSSSPLPLIRPSSSASASHLSPLCQRPGSRGSGGGGGGSERLPVLATSNNNSTPLRGGSASAASPSSPLREGVGGGTEGGGFPPPYKSHRIGSAASASTAINAAALSSSKNTSCNNSRPVSRGLLPPLPPPPPRTASLPNIDNSTNNKNSVSQNVPLSPIKNNHSNAISSAGVALGSRPSTPILGKISGGSGGKGIMNNIASTFSPSRPTTGGGGAVAEGRNATASKPPLGRPPQQQSTQQQREEGQQSSAVCGSEPAPLPQRHGQWDRERADDHAKRQATNNRESLSGEEEWGNTAAAATPPASSEAQSKIETPTTNVRYFESRVNTVKNSNSGQGTTIGEGNAQQSVSAPSRHNNAPSSSVSSVARQTSQGTDNITAATAETTPSSLQQTSKPLSDKKVFGNVSEQKMTAKEEEVPSTTKAALPSALTPTDNDAHTEDRKIAHNDKSSTKPTIVGNSNIITSSSGNSARQNDDRDASEESNHRIQNTFRQPSHRTAADETTTTSNNDDEKQKTESVHIRNSEITEIPVTTSASAANAASTSAPLTMIAAALTAVSQTEDSSHQEESGRANMTPPSPQDNNNTKQREDSSAAMLGGACSKEKEEDIDNAPSRQDANHQKDAAAVARHPLLTTPSAAVNDADLREKNAVSTEKESHGGGNNVNHVENNKAVLNHIAFGGEEEKSAERGKSEEGNSRQRMTGNEEKETASTQSPVHNPLTAAKTPSRQREVEIASSVVCEAKKVNVKATGNAHFDADNNNNNGRDITFDDRLIAVVDKEEVEKEERQINPQSKEQKKREIEPTQNGDDTVERSVKAATQSSELREETFTALPPQPTTQVTHLDHDKVGHIKTANKDAGDVEETAKNQARSHTATTMTPSVLPSTATYRGGEGDSGDVDNNKTAIIASPYSSASASKEGSDAPPAPQAPPPQVQLSLMKDDSVLKNANQNDADNVATTDPKRGKQNGGEHLGPSRSAAVTASPSYREESTSRRSHNNNQQLRGRTISIIDPPAEPTAMHDTGDHHDDDDGNKRNSEDKNSASSLMDKNEGIFQSSASLFYSDEDVERFKQRLQQRVDFEKNEEKARSEIRHAMVEETASIKLFLITAIIHDWICEKEGRKRLAISRQCGDAFISIVSDMFIERKLIFLARASDDHEGHNFPTEGVGHQTHAATAASSPSSALPSPIMSTIMRNANRVRLSELEAREALLRQQRLKRALQWIEMGYIVFKVTMPTQIPPPRQQRGEGAEGEEETDYFLEEQPKEEKEGSEKRALFSHELLSKDKEEKKYQQQQQVPSKMDSHLSFNSHQHPHRLALPLLLRNPKKAERRGMLIAEQKKHLDSSTSAGADEAVQTQCSDQQHHVDDRQAQQRHEKKEEHCRSKFEAAAASAPPFDDFVKAFFASGGRTGDSICGDDGVMVSVSSKEDAAKQSLDRQGKEQKEAKPQTAIGNNQQQLLLSTPRAVAKAAMRDDTMPLMKKLKLVRAMETKLQKVSERNPQSMEAAAKTHGAADAAYSSANPLQVLPVSFFHPSRIHKPLRHVHLPRLNTFFTGGGGGGGSPAGSNHTMPPSHQHFSSQPQQTRPSGINPPTKQQEEKVSTSSSSMRDNHNNNDGDGEDDAYASSGDGASSEDDAETLMMHHHQQHTLHHHNSAGTINTSEKQNRASSSSSSPSPTRSSPGATPQASQTPSHPQGSSHNRSNKDEDPHNSSNPNVDDDDDDDDEDFSAKLFIVSHTLRNEQQHVYQKQNIKQEKVERRQALTKARQRFASRANANSFRNPSSNAISRETATSPERAARTTAATIVTSVAFIGEESEEKTPTVANNRRNEPASAGVTVSSFGDIRECESTVFEHPHPYDVSFSSSGGADKNGLGGLQSAFSSFSAQKHKSVRWARRKTTQRNGEGRKHTVGITAGDDPSGVVATEDVAAVASQVRLEIILFFAALNVNPRHPLKRSIAFHRARAEARRLFHENAENNHDILNVNTSLLRHQDRDEMSAHGEGGRTSTAPRHFKNIRMDIVTNDQQLPPLRERASNGGGGGEGNDVIKNHGSNAVEAMSMHDAPPPPPHNADGQFDNAAAFAADQVNKTIDAGNSNSVALPSTQTQGEGTRTNHHQPTQSCSSADVTTSVALQQQRKKKLQKEGERVQIDEAVNRSALAAAARGALLALYSMEMMSEFERLAEEATVQFFETSVAMFAEWMSEGISMRL